MNKSPGMGTAFMLILTTKFGKISKKLEPNLSKPDVRNIRTKHLAKNSICLQCPLASVRNYCSRIYIYIYVSCSPLVPNEFRF